ncbi:hypothetical protein Q4493_06560 [Colwellia sp. 1_MG-2023]|uniref:hypothetical protein n=1 Tax=Colwellia sp. 1_MG-2023 TaxID=3062649 RepID=UPI0026E35BFD|nr:hypothetical protein [Colwellia sp. 1_MG-2023]MDO6445439.1 hypothetical protein [Colwellia sp. 1_MG-2023]
MFNQHGEFEISTQDKIIEIKLKGAFYCIGAKKYADTLKKVITSLNKSSFSLCVDITQVEGGTPEAFEELEKLNQWVITKGMTGKAFVKRSSLICSMLRKYCPTIRLQNCKGFYSTSEARAWLTSLTNEYSGRVA